MARLGDAALIPEADRVAVRVHELGSVTPGLDPRRVSNDDGLTLEPVVFGVDVVDLEVKNATRFAAEIRSLRQKDREVARVAYRGRPLSGSSNSTSRPSISTYQSVARTRSRTNNVR
jgi:hypothetical protein